MRKHYKLISSIVCLLLCISMITFGVYAASHNLINLSSQISFTPTRAKLKIIGGIRGQEGYSSTTALGATGYYGCNNGTPVNCEESTDGNTATFNKWDYGTINFAEYTETSTKTHPDPIYFYIQITNYVERNVKYTIEFTTYPTNLKLECFYYLEKEASKLTTTNGWWNPSEVTSKDQLTLNFQKDDNQMGEVNITNNVADFSSNVDTTLSTMMLVVKLSVDNNDNDIDDKLNFVVQAQ